MFTSSLDAQGTDLAPTVGAEGVPLWHAASLQALAGVGHGFSGRPGGLSQGSYASLNLSTRVDDDRAAVFENRRRVLVALQRPSAKLITLRQVHGANIVEVTAQAGPNIEADALLTRDPRAVLAILVADCVPILFADVKGRAVAAVHAGWRGTEARLVTAMVKRLQALHIEPTDLRVALGPAIGPCCFEIGADVASRLTAAFPNVDHAIGLRREHHVADLWALNQRALLESGVPAECVTVLRLCSVCDERFFSYRRDAKVTGRQGGMITLPQKN